MLLFQGNAGEFPPPAPTSRFVFSDTPADTPRDNGFSVVVAGVSLNVVLDDDDDDDEDDNVPFVMSRS